MRKLIKYNKQMKIIHNTQRITIIKQIIIVTKLVLLYELDIYQGLKTIKDGW